METLEQVEVAKLGYKIYTMLDGANHSIATFALASALSKVIVDPFDKNPDAPVENKEKAVQLIIDFIKKSTQNKDLWIETEVSIAG